MFHLSFVDILVIFAFFVVYELSLYFQLIMYNLGIDGIFQLMCIFCLQIKLSRMIFRSDPIFAKLAKVILKGTTMFWGIRVCVSAKLFPRSAGNVGSPKCIFGHFQELEMQINPRRIIHFVNFQKYFQNIDGPSLRY